MPTPTELFNYHLPSDLIAQSPIEPRDSCRLLILDKVSGSIEHKKFFEIVNYLKKGDLLVRNSTKVFKARLRGNVNGKHVEILLTRSLGKYKWEAIGKPGHRLQIGSDILFNGASTRVEDVKNGIYFLTFDRGAREVLELCEKYGEVPLPPYIKLANTISLDEYQTIYAKQVGSIAAPTAGFHFTNELIEKLNKLGVEIVDITLHVGIGTFKPIKTPTLEEHAMHSEFVEIGADSAAIINKAKREKRRIIAVGTTSVRALEGVASLNPDGAITEYAGDIDIFITPNYNFKIIDGLITNFHLPKTTLLALVCAIAGRENVIRAYNEAIDNKYRFYSFGDAMLII